MSRIAYRKFIKNINTIYQNYSNLRSKFQQKDVFYSCKGFEFNVEFLM